MPGSTAFSNILGVLTGGEVSLYRPQEWVQVWNADRTAFTWEYQYPMEDPSYRPPTMDVP